MIKAKICNGNTRSKLQELKQNGTYATIPFGTFGVQDSEWVKKLRTKFYDHYFSVSDKDWTEEVLSYIDEECEYEGTLTLPSSFGREDEDHLIEFENGIFLHINVVDEYYGGGEYDIGLSTQGVSVPIDMDESEMDKVIEWMREVLVVSE